MKTEMFRFGNGEETAGLLAETLNAITDARVSEIVIALDPSRGRPRKDRPEIDLTPVERATCMARACPGETEWRVFRETYGWSYSEIMEVRALLIACARGLYSDSHTAGISRETLQRDAERGEALAERWVDMLRADS